VGFRALLGGIAGRERGDQQQRTKEAEAAHGISGRAAAS
jgi:hypothetical protein